MSLFFSSKPNVVIPEFPISEAQALVIGRELALFNAVYWDDATATATLSKQFFDTWCWVVMPGYEKKEWIEQETDDYPTQILIDAGTGRFAGLAYTRNVVSAEELVGRHFKLPADR
jgi:hypothetical protein